MPTNPCHPEPRKGSRLIRMDGFYASLGITRLPFYD